MPDGSDARCAIHVRPAIISGRFAGMNRRADTNRDMTWPRLFLKCALNLKGRSHSVAPTLENCEYTIAFPALENDRAVMSFHFPRYNLIMPLQCSARFGRIRIPRLARPFHIGEQKSYGADGPMLHRTDYDLTPGLSQRPTRWYVSPQDSMKLEALGVRGLVVP